MTLHRLRSVTADDEPLVVHIYGSTRDDLEALPLDQVQKHQLIALQSQLQLADYARAFPHAEHSLIEVESRCVGRIIVDRQPTQIDFIDIALLPEFRGTGLGTSLINDLQAEARTQGVPLRLSVKISNTRAIALYERLGFVTDAGTVNDMYFSMSWSSERS